MSHIRNEDELRDFLLDLDRRLESADVAYEEGRWLKNIGRLSPSEQNRLEAERAAVLLDDQAFAVVNEWRHRATDLLLVQMCVVLQRLIMSARVEALPPIYELRTRIEQKVTGFKPTIGGRSLDRADVRQVLRIEPDRATRRAAWSAYEDLAAAVEADVIDLLRLRNAEAGKLGFNSYADQCLAIQGLDQPSLHSMFDSLMQPTDESYRQCLDSVADRLGLPSAMPWDLDYALAQLDALPDQAFSPDDIIQAAQDLAKGLGLEEAVSGVRVDILDIPWGGICVTIRVPDDVRILMKPTAGHRSYETMFHEFGHALHARTISQPVHVFREVGEIGPICEGMACTLARFTADPEWLATRPGIGPQTLVRYHPSWRDALLVHLRLLMAKSLFEYHMYGALDTDLSVLWRESLSSVMQVPYDDATGWADNLYWTTYPLYMQNYVLAEMIASQTHATLRSQHSHLVGESAVGAWLVDKYWALGASVDWGQRIESATGQKLSADQLVRDLLVGW